MSDPELLKLTASEPLSIDQEYEMQETWRNDEDSTFYCKLKNHCIFLRSHTLHCAEYIHFSECTFLVLNKEIFERTKDEIGLLNFNSDFNSVNKLIVAF